MTEHTTMKEPLQQTNNAYGHDFSKWKSEEQGKLVRIKDECVESPDYNVWRSASRSRMWVSGETNILKALSNNNPHIKGLFGARIDANDGPKTAIRPVAKYKIEGRLHSPDWILETNNITTDIIRTLTERDANYVHAGWSQIATSANPPWMGSRIGSNQQMTVRIKQTTRMILFQRLSVEIPSSDLVPVAEFEDVIRDALEGPTLVDRFQRLSRVFQLW
ncbi:hypothetical protein RhiJN_24739 [Ceratobasidium sp. AG-Ba]|nr:hypothetical protein RhiJN_24739 [Ceratobasidium sp. AG-Ba]